MAAFAVVCVAIEIQVVQALVSAEQRLVGQRVAVLDRQQQGAGTGAVGDLGRVELRSLGQAHPLNVEVDGLAGLAGQEQEGGKQPGGTAGDHGFVLEEDGARIITTPA